MYCEVPRPSAGPNGARARGVGPPRGSVVVGADADADLDRLARRVGAALVVGRLLVEDGQRGRADERAVLLARGRVLQRAVRARGDAGGDVLGAALEERARRGAEVALHALDGHL